MREKLHIRLPTDPGPNPYDSATPYQKPLWLTWKWWLGVIIVAAVWYGLRVLNGTAI